MSHYPTLPDDDDFSMPTAPTSYDPYAPPAPTSSITTSSVLPPPPPSYLTQHQHVPQQYDDYHAPQQHSEYHAPVQQHIQQPDYAPPLHALPQQQVVSSGPPQWVPACIPNPNRVPYGNPCFIICGRNNMYLNVNQVIPNCPINVWTKTHSAQQKWYFTEDGYIELAADRTFVLDCVNVQVGAQLVLGKKKISQHGNAVDPAIVSQKWNVMQADGNNYLCNVQKPSLVVELAGSTKDYEKGDLVRINTNLSLNNDHQRWSFKTTYTGQTKEERLIPYGSKCYIYNAVTGLYLTVKSSGLLGGKAKPGQQVIFSKGKMLSGAKSQQWIFDKEGFITSALDKTGNLVLDAKSGQCGEELIVNTKQFTNNLGQKWLVKQAIGQPIDKSLNIKACRYLYSQLNTNLVLDEKGVNEAAYLNFNKNSTIAQLYKVKTV